ncbi:cytochrome P450 71A1-like isoform X2 [Ananas comosus]|uniref:Cytochrome P450 71A1-like isoform X2 n=1 Tax=Ananas comosus TaxID=4615 RepID=A0A6P5ELJ1_ANACO|nr:cytochrome P450 71A1-like isoform X2 [Ananas comosus]
MHPILAFVLLLPLFLLLSITKRALSKKPNFPPSPPRLPLIGNLHQLGSLPHLSLTSLSKKYGPLMLLRLGEIRTLIVSTPDMAREVMKTHDLSFANRPTSKVTEILLYNNMDVGFSPYGDYFPRLAWLGVFFGLSSRARRNFERLDDLLDEVIVEHEDRKKVDEEKDFVDVLLSLQKDSNLDFKLEKDHMKAILADMFGAGTETTSITLEWAMAEIVRNFKVMKKLQDEVRGIVGKNHVVREDDLNSMTYLKAVVKETLRLHPPAPLLIPRESIEDRYIKDYFIPKKTRVIVNGWAINRDPEFWEEPNEFRPERFIDSSVDFKGNDLQFIPFGAGRRICPGIQFAVLNIELALANLIHRFEWELPHGLRREELDMNEKPGLVTRRAEKLHLVAKPCLP